MHITKEMKYTKNYKNKFISYKQYKKEKNNNYYFKKSKQDYLLGGF